MEHTAPASPLDPRSAFLEEKAFKSRTVLIFGTITDSSAAETARRLIALDVDSALRARQRIAELIARETGKPLVAVLRDIERDHWLSAIEAVEYGLVGRIIERRDAP